MAVGPHRPGPQSVDPGEERLAPLDRQPARVAAPGGGLRQALVRRPGRAGRCGARSPGEARGRAGLARMATIRSTSRASPSTASTAGPGSAFHGSAASRAALVSRTSRQVASSASLGAIRVPGAGGRRRRPRPPTAASGLDGSRGRPDARRTSLPPRWPPGPAGCPGCWPGRRCSGRPCPRRRSRRRARRPGRAGSGSGSRRPRTSATRSAGAIWSSADLRHLLPADQQEAVHVDVGGRLDAGGHQQRRPVDAVEPQDVLADQVVHRRPPAGEPLGVGRRSRWRWRS